jgi:hypothetical protein
MTYSDTCELYSRQPGRGSPSFLLRFPDEAMRNRIMQLAKENDRSINAEIIARLKRSIQADSLSDRIVALQKRVEVLEQRTAMPQVCIND